MEKFLEKNLKTVRGRIEKACLATARNPSSVLLVAVSKGHSASEIEELYSLGHRDFGESYVQEWLPKLHALSHLPDIRWHFIGHLQSKKAKHIAGNSFLIHSVDRDSVFVALEKQAIARNMIFDVLVEVEVSEDDMNKGGVSSEMLESFVAKINACQSLRLKGFMGMGPASATNAELRGLYEGWIVRVKSAWALTKYASIEPVLSLGMSNDLEIAIAAGSTMVRVGTSLFGERDYSR